MKKRAAVFPSFFLRSSPLSTLLRGTFMYPKLCAQHDAEGRRFSYHLCCTIAEAGAEAGFLCNIHLTVYVFRPIHQFCHLIKWLLTVQGNPA